MEITALEKYDAILQKNTAYEGIFFTAVKTTGGVKHSQFRYEQDFHFYSLPPGDW